jgi:hypothetical protein
VSGRPIDRALATWAVPLCACLSRGALNCTGALAVVQLLQLMWSASGCIAALLKAKGQFNDREVLVWCHLSMTVLS